MLVWIAEKLLLLVLMKLTSVEYDPTNTKWYTLEYLPNNSRYILIYSPEFGTSIGNYDKFENGGIYQDILRIGEDIKITHWREMPRYVPCQSDL